MKINMENQVRKYTSPILTKVLAKRNIANYEKTKRNMLLAARIDDALKLKGFSKKQLADLMEKRPSEITKWLSGTHNFTLETLYRIETYLGVTLFMIPDGNLQEA
jgi:ribosome-binding protein aMBF1 (putative translation factor)